MFARLLLLFTVVPALELYLLIRIGEWIGAVETVLIILITGSIGAWLAKREGLEVVRTLQQDTLQGIPPGDRIVEGLLVLVGGVLLITPGVLTDLTGFLLIMPPSRRFLAPRVKDWATRKLLNGANVTVYGGRPRDPLRRPQGTTPRPDAGGFSHPVGDVDPTGGHGFPQHPVPKD